MVLGEELGSLEPCGCAPGMLGGIARRETAIRQIQKTNPNVLVLHNGDLLKSFGPQAALKRDTETAALNRLSLAAMGVGVGEFILGGSSLLLFQKSVSFPLLCANLEDREKQISFLPSSSVVLPLKPQPLTVRVFSLISPSFQSDLNRLVPGLQVKPIEAKLKEWEPNKKENEFWVLLFQGPPYEAQNLAAKKPQFDLIVYSHIGDTPIYQKIGGANLASTGSKGRSFLTLRFKGAAPFDVTRNDRIVLNDQVASSPEVQALLAQYKAKVKEEKLAEKFPKVRWPGGATYAGSEACATCHQAEYATWKNSKHSQALQSLSSGGNAHDPECLQCHSAAFDFQGGFVSQEKTPTLANVSCESCHGPRSLHIAAPRENKGPSASRNTCLQCHDADNSPSFDFDTYWPKIQHGSKIQRSAKVEREQQKQTTAWNWRAFRSRCRECTNH